MVMIKKFELTDVQNVDGTKSIKCGSCSDVFAVVKDNMKCPKCGASVKDKGDTDV